MKPRHILLLLSALCLSAACGQTEQPPEGSPYDDAEVHSGSRLRARWLEAEDARQFLGWYDTELDMRCYFVELKDGYRCIPSQVYIGYLDAACSQQVAFGAHGPGLYSVRDPGSDLCGSPPSVELVRLGEAVPNVGDVYADGGCSSITGDIEETYQVTERIPLKSTVSARQATKSIDTRLERRLLVSEDGAQEPSALYDRKLQSGVFAEADRLAPFASEVWMGYADPECTEPLRPVASSECPREFGVLDANVIDACLTHHEYFRITTQQTDITQTNVWGYCQGTPDTAFEVEELPRSDLASVTVDASGSGRIKQLTARATDSGESLGASGWLDSRWGSECEVGLDEEGKYRCLPKWGPSAVRVSYNRFRDASCSLPLAQPVECSAVVRFALDYTTRYEVLGVERLSQAYSIDDGACTLHALADFDNYVLSPLTPEDFVAFREVIE
ncbi:MAG: hypothetical protein AB7S68_42015 [Polyangiaceae bacterium]